MVEHYWVSLTSTAPASSDVFAFKELRIEVIKAAGRGHRGLCLNLNTACDRLVPHCSTSRRRRWWNTGGGWRTRMLGLMIVRKEPMWKVTAAMVTIRGGFSWPSLTIVTWGRYGNYFASKSTMRYRLQFSCNILGVFMRTRWIHHPHNKYGSKNTVIWFADNYSLQFHHRSRHRIHRGNVIFRSKMYLNAEMFGPMRLP